MDRFLENGLKLALIGGLHAVLIGTLAAGALRPQLLPAICRLDVRVIHDDPAPQPLRPQPARLPARARALPAQPAPPQVESAPASAVMTSLAETPAPEQSYTVAAQPSVPVPVANTATAAVAAPAQAAPPVRPPRYDAGYLHNPAPAYPRASRLAGQQGQVTLKVLVSARGLASSVQVLQSSGFARLDEAALDAVRQWRFEPAKRGAEAIEDWVLVPIAFRLDA